jgi:hypothetical protein
MCEGEVWPMLLFWGVGPSPSTPRWMPSLALPMSRCLEGCSSCPAQRHPTRERCLPPRIPI